MKNPSFRRLIATVPVVGIICAVLSLSGCTREEPGAQKQKVERAYSEPRHPAYLKKPTSVEEIMPYARAAVRQAGGRTPLGTVEAGKTVALFAGSRALLDPNPLVLEALVEAYKELNVKALVVLPEPEDSSVPIGRGFTSGEGYMEVRGWIEGFPDPEEPKAWLRQQDPGSYEKLYPKDGLHPGRVPIDPKVIQRLKAHPSFRFRRGSPKEFLDQQGANIDAVFAGSGGRQGTQKGLGKHGGKFYGNFTFDDYQDIMNKVPSFPGDLWRLVEERTIEPLAWADRAQVTDPEGTDFSLDVTEKQARDWAEGTYLPGHLLLFPTHVSAQIPVSYIPRLTRWIEVFMPVARGVVAGTRSHTGVYPRIEVIVDNSRIKEVKGGGEYGDGWRAFLNWPKLREVQYPYYEKAGPGYWFPYECALGTNPKFFMRYDQAMVGMWTSERESAGVLHWGFGVEVRYDRPGQEGTFEQFLKRTNVRGSHGYHIHSVFPTYKVRIRGTDRWVTLVDKGRVTALDNPEVRVLASRYGNPDELLQNEWRPDIPGINSPGKYEDYARDPWAHITKIMKQIEDGTYPYLRP